MQKTPKNVRYWRVVRTVAESWFWVILSLIVMLLFTVVALLLVVRLIPPPALASAFIGVVLLSIFAFFFSEFLINIFMGAQRVDPKKYPHFVEAMERIRKDRGMWLQPRMRIMPLPMPNAMAYGCGILGQCSIAITPRLYRMCNKEELTAVVAHEYGHIRSLDVGLMTVVSVLMGTMEQLRKLLFRPANPITWIPAAILFFFSRIAFGLLRSAISQEREYAADALGAWYIGSPDPLIGALQKLEAYRDNR